MPAQAALEEPESLPDAVRECPWRPRKRQVVSLAELLAARQWLGAPLQLAAGYEQQPIELLADRPGRLGSIQQAI